MILAVDIGNTRAKFGLFRSAVGRVPQVMQISACPLAETATLEVALADWLAADGNEPVTNCVLAGSNPPVRDLLRQAWPLPGLPPTVIEDFRDVPLAVDVDEPAKLGIDRLLSAFAVKMSDPSERPAVIVDSGTATTVDLLTSDGVFRGGSILPGLRLSAYALHDYTARLPLIDTDARLTTEPSVPGRNTDEAICAGLFWGQLGAVRELVSRLSQAAAERFHEVRPPRVVISGGGGRQLMPHFPNATFIDSLALHGLALTANAEE
ncbi:MAG: type III pantothenate kinase [Planctomycetaceae bacterium]